MNKKYFLDISRLTYEDIQDIKAICRAFNLEFNEGLHRYMNENPGKVKILGELNNGIVTRNEITKDGVKEYNGQKAIKKIMDEVWKNKEKE